MRIASAWFLLFISVAQWVGGHLCFEVNYLIEIQRQMNDAELALANEVRKETGINSAVRILSEDEITPRGNFYGDFVFSKSDEVEKTFYVVENQTELTTQKVISNTPDQKESNADSRQAKHLKSLFQEFMMPETEALATPLASSIDLVFHYTAPCSFPFSPVFIHPPAQA